MAGSGIARVSQAVHWQAFLVQNWKSMVDCLRFCYAGDSDWASARGLGENVDDPCCYRASYIKKRCRGVVYLQRKIVKVGELHLVPQARYGTLLWKRPYNRPYHCAAKRLG